jgi:hypothetical protein
MKNLTKISRLEQIAERSAEIHSINAASAEQNRVFLQAR